MRSFVSVDLPASFADRVADVQSAFADASGLSFTDPGQAHVTLTFLGDVDPDRRTALESELATAVENAGVSPFSVTYGGLGVFPDLSYVSVIWLGVLDGGDELTHLHEAVERRTTAMGFEADSHEFTPHVTLARMEHAGGKDLVQELVTDWPASAETAAMDPAIRHTDEGPIVGETTVEEIRLTESTLGPDGPTYETVTRFPLE
ncbi:RNA 2',3'-cyclic phosphodiesterase [Halovivax gelatinilyticus]|uniref:RNA 2',3'-cyclic phosphodiesterase n=1 Tax=Halovivax gelatinilyticus TaxID=2961597 RepID=UPI0020CA6EC6|nr:RNA 2',3'-cyclic phosphodiesterase [Halovivax gelatinilyticus]